MQSTTSDAAPEPSAAAAAGSEDGSDAPAGPRWARILKRFIAALLAIAAVYVAFIGAQLWQSWSDVERASLNTAGARALALPLEEPPDLVVAGNLTPMEELPVASPAPPGTYRSLLLIGTDEAAGLADVILLTVLPVDGTDPFMVSLPRDLYVPNHCTGRYTRINATLRGCGNINGPTALTLAVEDFTGIRVDHFALFDFAGFASIIDGVGGVEICVEHARTDWRANLELPAGCSQADGQTALAWVRSRHPRELVDGTWRSVPGASDLSRNRAQQGVLLQLLGKLKAFDSPAALTSKIRQLSGAFMLDDGLGLTDVIALGWSLRDLDAAEVNRLEIPVVYATTDRGQTVLQATQGFDELLAVLYQDLVARPYER